MLSIIKFKFFTTVIILSSAIALTQAKAETITQTQSVPLIANINSLKNVTDKQNNQNNNNALIYAIRPLEGKKDKAGSRKPGSKFGAACPSVSPPLTALVPGNSDNSFIFFTAREKPIFWFYVPYSSKLPAEFSLFNEKNERIYQATYSLAEKAGIVNILSPVKIEINKEYTWSFQVQCSPRNRSHDKTVYGKVQRVLPTPSLVPRRSTPPEKKVILLAKDGLWSDTLTTILKELRPINPSKYKAFLNDLLGVYQLNEYADKEIVECCKVNK